MRNIKKLTKILVIILLISIFSFNLVRAYEVEEETDYIWMQEQITEATSNSYKEPIMSSRYVVAIDRNSKTVLYGKNQNTKVPMASTTKIMTAIVLIEQMNEKGLSLNTEVEVCKQAASIGGSRLGLKTGDKITINNLLYGLMLCSGNDAAVQIAVSIAGSVEQFADLMNNKAKEMGLNNTHFVTPHGLDSEEHYTTAYELAIIADYALNIEKISEVVKTKTYTVNINDSTKTITNTNELLGYLNGVDGVKTGFTNGAGRCLVTSVNRDNFNIITVVLGADTKKIRTKDSIKLIEYIYSNYKLVNLEELINEEFLKWSSINKKRIYINKGIEENIKLGLDQYKYKTYPVKIDNIKNINILIENEQMYLEAPVHKNTNIANLVVKLGETEVMNINIVTKNNIEKKNQKDYIFECIRQIFY